jgi:hypothetical protein
MAPRAPIDVRAPLAVALQWTGTRPAPTAPETEGLQPATEKETSRANPIGSLFKTLRSTRLPSRVDFTITCSKSRVLSKVYSLDPTQLQKDRTALASLAFAHTEQYDTGSATVSYLLLQPLSSVKKNIMPIFFHLRNSDLDNIRASRKKS